MTSILKDDLQFPNDILISKSCKTLIENLLEKDPLIRIDLYSNDFYQWISEE